MIVRLFWDENVEEQLELLQASLYSVLFSRLNPSCDPGQSRILEFVSYISHVSNCINT
jgi:hypothetical protein